MTLRIGWNLDKALDPRDGVGQYCHQLLKALMAIDPENDYVLYPLHAAVSEEDLERNFPARPENFRLAPAGRRTPGPTDVDLMHATTWTHPVGFRKRTGTQRAKGSGQVPFTGKVLFTCYDLTFLSHPECHTVDNRIACLEGTLRAHLAGAHFLAISRATSAEMQTRLGVPPERISVIYPAAADHFHPERGKASAPAAASDAARTRESPSGEYLLAVGTLEPRKNLVRLIEAYSRLPSELRSRYSLRIAGGGGWKQENLPVAQPIEGVHWLGPVSDEQLVELYRGAALFAYPSLAEGFGLPIVEAMACGTPVITSNVSSLIEVAGDAAVTVDPLDVEALTREIADLLEDTPRQAMLRERGLQRAADFSWQRTAEQVLALYRRLTASDTPR
ncbi:MAG: glycosyltransferase family 4 protein [Thermoanaerobaculia bacterium]|nr:glycosyltransferase family 4 protein [Thermoanaerobaculia bacterium]